MIIRAAPCISTFNTINFLIRRTVFTILGPITHKFTNLVVSGQHGCKAANSQSRTLRLDLTSQAYHVTAGNATHVINAHFDHLKKCFSSVSGRFQHATKLATCLRDWLENTGYMVTTMRSPCRSEFLPNTRQRLHVNVLVASLLCFLGGPVLCALSYIQNDYFLCKSMNEIRATGTYTCHVPLLSRCTGCLRMHAQPTTGAGPARPCWYANRSLIMSNPILLIYQPFNNYDYTSIHHAHLT